MSHFTSPSPLMRILIKQKSEYTVPNVIGAEVCQSAALGPSWYKHKGLKLAGTSKVDRKITYCKSNRARQPESKT